MPRTTEIPAPIANAIDSDAIRVTTELMRTLAAPRARLMKACECADSSTQDRCSVEAAGDRIHLEFDSYRQCDICGTPWVEPGPSK